MTRLKRVSGLGMAAALGLLLVAVMQASLAWAAQPVAGGTSRAHRLSRALAPDAPSILLTKTVGFDPAVCATTSTLAAPAGARVYYCYEIGNTGTVSVTTHTLVDNRLGTILTNFPFSLLPGASAFITQAATITPTTVNSATWSATGPNVVVPVRSSDQATVTVVPLSLELNKTVGLDPNVCALDSTLLITSAMSVTYCYQIRNTGQFTLTRHYLSDNELGPILTNFPFTLVPGASAFLTQTALITQSTVNTGTWSAVTAYSTNAITTTASALVLFVTDEIYLPVLRR